MIAELYSCLDTGKGHQVLIRTSRPLRAGCRPPLKTTRHTTHDTQTTTAPVQPRDTTLSRYTLAFILLSKRPQQLSKYAARLRLDSLGTVSVDGCMPRWQQPPMEGGGVAVHHLHNTLSGVP